jgi:hypothetical protein
VVAPACKVVEHKHRERRQVHVVLACAEMVREHTMLRPQEAVRARRRFRSSGRAGRERDECRRVALTIAGGSTASAALERASGHHPPAMR